MRYCKKCIQPDTRPGIQFDENGVCAACVSWEKRQDPKIWVKRSQEFKEIIEWAKSMSSPAMPYDCVIGVSGGKDSTFQALYCKEQLGLNCLLVSCEPDAISETGRKNKENLTQHGFDVITIRPNPKVERELSRRAFFQYGNFVKPLEFPLYASAFRIAYHYGIHLVIEGENPGETLGCTDYYALTGDATQWKDGDTVGGGDISIWIGAGIEEKDLFPYVIPSDEALASKNIRAIFLGFYVKEWSNANNRIFSVAHGLSGRPDHDPLAIGRTKKHTSLDADLKIVNHNILKWFKFGYSIVTDELCPDIRQGIITRDRALQLAKRYDGQISDLYIQRFCDYLDITLAEFWENVDRWVNRKLFYQQERTGRWLPRFVIGEGLVL